MHVFRARAWTCPRAVRNGTFPGLPRVRFQRIYPLRAGHAWPRSSWRDLETGPALDGAYTPHRLLGRFLCHTRNPRSSPTPPPSENFTVGIRHSPLAFVSVGGLRTRTRGTIGSSTWPWQRGPRRSASTLPSRRPTGDFSERSRMQRYAPTQAMRTPGRAPVLQHTSRNT